MSYAAFSRKLFRTLPIVVLLALLPFQVLAGAKPETLAKRLDAVLVRALQEQRVVGGVVLVARNGKIVYNKAFGLSDRESHVPTRRDTVFRLASMTKPLVSAAAMALIDQGRLSMDDTVARWLPDFAPRLADGGPAAITVRQLLTHTAGLSYGFLEAVDGPLAKAGVSDGLDRPGITLEENVRRLAGVPLSYAPGAGWKYSLSIDVLGAVVAKAGGGTLPEVVARLVTGPLGMRDTVFVVTRLGRLATPYVLDGGGLHRMTDPEFMPFGVSGVRYQPSRATDKEAFPSGGAGLSGTARDYLKFLEAVRRDGGGILTPETSRAMTANQIAPLVPDATGPDYGWGFGAAVLLNPREGKHPGAPGTWRWGGVYGTSFLMDRASGLSVVILTNTTPEGMDGAFPKDVYRAVYGR